MLRTLISGCRENASRLTLFRHCAGSTRMPPQTTVTEVSKNVRLEKHSAPSDTPRPLVVLLGWMFAKPAHLKKFSDIYIEQGFDVITVRVRVGQLLFPKRVQALTRDIIDFCQSGDLKYQPLMTHGFSVGGYMYGEFLVNLENHPERYHSTRSRLCAQVFDSPVDFQGVPKGLSQAITSNAKTQATLRKTLEWYLSTFSDSILRDYKRASTAFHDNSLKLPSIFFYSLSDPVCDTEIIEKLALSWQDRGLEVSTVFWERAPHVCTYRKYPDQYKQSLLEFIWRSGIKGHIPVQDISDDDDVICERLVKGFHYFDIPMQAMTMMHNGYKLLDCVTGKLQKGGKDDGERATLYVGRQPKNHVIVSYSSLLSLFDKHTHLVTQ